MKFHILILAILVVSSIQSYPDIAKTATGSSLQTTAAAGYYPSVASFGTGNDVAYGVAYSTAADGSAYKIQAVAPGGSNTGAAQDIDADIAAGKGTVAVCKFGTKTYVIFQVATDKKIYQRELTYNMMANPTQGTKAVFWDTAFSGVISKLGCADVNGSFVWWVYDTDKVKVNIWSGTAATHKSASVMVDMAATEILLQAYYDTTAQKITLISGTTAATTSTYTKKGTLDATTAAYTTGTDLSTVWGGEYLIPIHDCVSLTKDQAKNEVKFVGTSGLNDKAFDLTDATVFNYGPDATTAAPYAMAGLSMQNGMMKNGLYLYTATNNALKAQDYTFTCVTVVNPNSSSDQMKTMIYLVGSLFAVFVMIY